jgi:hypothetical protein
LFFDISGTQTDNPLEKKAIVDDIITGLRSTAIVAIMLCTGI